MSIPNDLRYSDEHAWVKVEDNHVRIGITQFAQSELGDIVFVELPESDEEVEANEPFGSVESVKTVSELYSPINGKIVEINENLEDNPELVNESPYDKAWMLIVTPADMNEVDELMSAEEYRKMVSGDE